MFSLKILSVLLKKSMCIAYDIIRDYLGEEKDSQDRGQECVSKVICHGILYKNVRMELFCKPTDKDIR